MFIWNTNNGLLIKEFKFFAPGASSFAINLGNSECEDPNIFTESCMKSRESSIISTHFSSLTRYFKSVFNKRFDHQNFRGVTSDELVFNPPPTMCLYSKDILITGGFSCIFLWNITKGELFKKINIKTTAINKHRYDLSNRFKYSQLNLVKQIKVIQQKKVDSSLNIFPQSMQTANNRNTSKLLLVMDYTDSIYIIKIPSNLIQNLA
jgi:hypothetical protein